MVNQQYDWHVRERLISQLGAFIDRVPVIVPTLLLVHDRMQLMIHVPGCPLIKTQLPFDEDWDRTQVECECVKRACKVN